MATQNLLEAYRKRLSVSESVHQRSHNGAKMSPQKKLMIATVLNNTSRFINEAFDQSAATQRSALGDYKKFCLNITTIALPNLILPELMLTQPMTSFTGFVTYLRYVSGTAKGGVGVGDMFNSVYSLGQMTEDRMRYTSSAVAEDLDKSIIPASLSDFDTTDISLQWTPIHSVKRLVFTKYDKDPAANSDAKIVARAYIDNPEVDSVYPDGLGPNTLPSGDDKYTGLTKNGKIKFKNLSEALLIPDIGDTSEFSTLTTDGTYAVKVLYIYDNIEIPQKVEPTSLPTLKAKMSAISLQAHARRIAIYYSQISAFQAKQDYGFDLGDQLAQQATGELQYEIDSEGVQLLYNGAEHDDKLDFDTYDQTTLQGISRSQYYEGFNEIVNRAKAIIYQRTQKFSPNYMVVGSDVLTILPFLAGWNAAPIGTVNGPYMAGTLNGLKVFVSPAIPSNEYFFGVNGADLQTSAAIYAPYMSVVPTQLLGFPDGTMTQGFSTMYDMKLLSTYDRVGDRIVENPELDGGQYSYLLVKGKLNTQPSMALRIMGIGSNAKVAIEQ